MEPKTEIALLKKDIEDLREEIKTLNAEVKDLVDAWKAANGVVMFVKWLSGGAVALSSLYFLLKGVK